MLMRQWRAFGGIDLLFNNAGIMGQVAPLEELDEHVFDDLFRINIKSVWLGMRCVKSAMEARGGGAIINTASAGRINSHANVIWLRSEQACSGRDD
jgi:NAD(P)-dependent dehydrogenase (short-subunit alcohol dehydrogenase family)